MKNILKLLSCFVILLSGLANAQQTEIDADFFKENIAITNAYVRSIDEKQYVKELQLQNFSEEKFSVQKLSFQDIKFADDGKENDLIANDGIYTSIEIFNHNDVVKYTGKKQVSVLSTPVIDSVFKYGGPQASVTCDIEFGVGGCRAESYGWCSKCCFSLSNCSVTIGWG